MRSVAKWGVIVGVATYAVSQILYVISALALGASPEDPSHPAGYVLQCVELLLIAFAFSAAGFYTGRETRLAGMGALAGMLTFAIYGLLLSVIPLGAHVAPSSNGLPLGQEIVVEIVSVTLILAIAAFIGWLGGRPGATRGKAIASRATASIDVATAIPSTNTDHSTD